MNESKEKFRDVFGKRFQKVRKRNLKLQKDIAKIFEVTPKSITHYENAVRVPTLSNLRMFATMFDVETDYLLGLNDTYDFMTDKREMFFDAYGERVVKDVKRYISLDKDLFGKVLEEEEQKTRIESVLLKVFVKAMADLEIDNIEQKTYHLIVKEIGKEIHQLLELAKEGDDLKLEIESRDSIQAYEEVIRNSIFKEEIQKMIQNFADFEKTDCDVEHDSESTILQVMQRQRAILDINIKSFEKMIINQAMEQEEIKNNMEQ